MTSVFVVRPFSTKPVEGDNRQHIDFDEIHEKLIAPAISELGLSGGDAMEFVHAGNIRADMITALLRADLVIADLTIHNANVFYELGIRHALRKGHTVVIRGKFAGQGAYPFDVHGYRYLDYDVDHPETYVEELSRSISETMAREPGDSPVFGVLPLLRENDLAEFHAVPATLADEISSLAARKQRGDLRLLAAECHGAPWEAAALTTIGDAQMRFRDWEGARTSFKRILENNEDDVPSTLAIATVHERLNELEDSSNSLNRLTDAPLTSRQRAEHGALLARNHKLRWQATWSEITDPEERQQRALKSSLLEDARSQYRRAFDSDLNAYYPGINALAMATILIQLSDRFPGVWTALHDNEEDARTKRDQLLEECAELQVLVNSAVSTAPESEERWIRETQADLSCLKGDSSDRVAILYSRAAEQADEFAQAAMRRQLEILCALDVNGEAAAAGLDEIAQPAENQEHVIFFAGHMIDAADRATPRFPADQEDTARDAIRAALEKEREQRGRIDRVISGAASGGDILFQEEARKIGIDREIYLPLDDADYVAKSVAPAGDAWVDRFNDVCEGAEIRRMPGGSQFSDWCDHLGDDYTIWKRNNLWILSNALAGGRKNATLITLWDGEPTGDGLGGTSDLVKQTEASGGLIRKLNTRELFGL